MTDPLDAHGDALRQALHTETRQTFVCNPHALEDIRARTAQQDLRVDTLLVAVLLTLYTLLLLLTLGGS